MEWSTMLPELLDVIAHKHIVFYEDYPSFAWVCKSWHSAAVRAVKGSRPPSRLPCLMLPEKKDDEEFRELFLLSNQTTHKIRLPEAYGKLCMPSCGWLVTVGEDHASQLINPLSREIINLPKIDASPRLLASSKWYNDISKLVFFAPLSLIVVLWGDLGELVFCCIGENKWTPVDKGLYRMIFDITYYNERVYSFDDKFHIRAWDVYGEDPTLTVDISRLPDVYTQDLHLGGAYILGMNDDERKRLLVILREGVASKQLHVVNFETTGFHIVEYDLASGKWSKVNNVGSKTLFVGYNSSFWIEDTTGVIKSNSVYFTDDGILYHTSINEGGRDMGICHLSNRTIEPHFTGEQHRYVTPPIWLQSM